MFVTQVLTFICIAYSYKEGAIKVVYIAVGIWQLRQWIWVFQDPGLIGSSSNEAEQRSRWIQTAFGLYSFFYHYWCLCELFRKYDYAIQTFNHIILMLGIIHKTSSLSDYFDKKYMPGNILSILFYFAVGFTFQYFQIKFRNEETHEIIEANKVFDRMKNNEISNAKV